MKKQNLAKQLLVFFALIIAAPMLRGQVSAEVDSQFTWYANGPIRTSVLSGDTLFFGGEFTELGKPCKNAALLRSNGLLQRKHNGDLPYTGAAIAHENGFFVTQSVNDAGAKDKNYNIGFLDTLGNITARFNNLSFNGPIYKMLVNNDKLYVGGGFTAAGSYIGYGTTYDAALAQKNNFPIINGEIMKCIPDNNGGWYIVGRFTKVGDKRRVHAARINADGSVHDWNPDIEETGTISHVKDIVLHGDTVYMGGNFTINSPKDYRVVVGVDANSGEPKDWEMVSWMAGTVNCLAIVNDKLFVGGNFTSISSITFTNMACFDLKARKLTNYKPGFDGEVFTILPRDGKLYVGGAFTKVNSQQQKGLALIDTALGNTLYSSPSCNGTVKALLSTATDLYFGGQFDSVFYSASKYVRGNLASFNYLVQQVNTNFIFNANGPVNSLSIDGVTLYLGGGFYMINGSLRNKLAGINLINKNILPPSYNLGLVTDAINTVCYSGNTLYAGANFGLAATTGFTGLACIDLNTNAVIPSWKPVIQIPGNWPAQVTDIEIKNSTLYFCGSFTSVNGQPRTNLAAIDTGTTALLPLNINFNDAVNAITILNNKLFCAGVFTTVNSQFSRAFSVVNLNNNTIIPYYISISVVYVNDILVKNDKVYLGGRFYKSSAPASEKEPCLIALDTATLTYIPTWKPNTYHLSPITRLYDIDNKLHVAGTAKTIYSAPLSCHAAYDYITGAAEPFNPRVNSFMSASVQHIAKNGDNILITGSFDFVNATSRSCAAALNLATNQLTDYAPPLNNYVYAMEMHNNTMYVGGAFTQRLLTTDRNTGALLPWKVTNIFNGAVYTIAFYKNMVIAGGDFNAAQNNILAFDTINASVIPTWNRGASAPVRKLRIYNDTLFVAGDFHNFGNVTNWRIGRLLLTNNTVLPSFNQNFTSTGGIRDFYKDGNNIYAVGSFQSSPLKFGVNIYYNASTQGAVGVWKPDFTLESNYDAGLHCILPVDKYFFVGGAFSHAGRYAASSIGCIDDSTGKAFPWSVQVNRVGSYTDMVATLQKHNGYLIAGGGNGVIPNQKSGILVKYKLKSHEIREEAEKEVTCAGTVIDVKVFPIENYNPGNVFRLELSDASGSFSSPTVLESVTSNKACLLSGKIPTTLPDGNYKLRIVSTSPANVSNNPINIIIRANRTSPVITGPSISNRGNREVYSVAGTPGSTYLWTVEKGFLVSGQNTNKIDVNWIIYKNGYEGKVKVREINTDGCVSDQAIQPVQVDVWPSSAGVAGNESITLYPNPFTGSFVVLLAEDMETADLQVYSITGQLVLAETGFTGGTIDMSGLPSGVYILEILSNGTTVTQKIVKADE